MRRFPSLCLLLGLMLCGRLSGGLPHAVAQTSRLISFEALQWYNPWLEGASPSGMWFVAQGHSEFALTGALQTGAFRNVYDPQVSQTYGLQTRSYQKWGKAVVYGDFRYHYQQRRGQQWLGLIDPTRTPFLLADSVAGNYTLEQYRMQAAVAFPVGAHWVLGLKAHYRTYSGAKHKDLRNANTYMDFLASGSALYHNGPLRIGVYGHYNRLTEQVDYTQVETSTNKTLFSFTGLWYATRTVYASTVPHTRLLHDTRWEGGLTVEYRVGAWDVFNEASANYGAQTQREDVVLAQLYGEVYQWTLSDRLVLQYHDNHRLTAQAVWENRSAYKPIQQKELNTASRLWEWVTYGSAYCYDRENLTTSLSYTGRVARDRWNNAWRWHLEATHRRTRESVYAYPMQEDHFRRFTSLSAEVTRNWLGKKGMLELAPALAYGWGQWYGERTQDALGSDDSWQLQEWVARENQYLTTPRLGVGGRLTGTLFLKKTTNLYLAAECKWEHARELQTSRTYATLALGVSF